MNTFKAIETRYKGYRFRSRLEARWAVFFDALGTKWEYEKEGYELPSGHYLPDFWLPYGPFGDPEMVGAGFWVEIKPIAPTQHEMQLMAELVKCTGHRGYIFSGQPDVGCGVVVFQHWRGGEPEHVAMDGYISFNPLLSFDVAGDFVVAHPSTNYGPCNLPFSRVWPPLNGSDAIEAIHSARSARFEHGEQG